MDWDDLRYFLAAYRHGSLAGAARELRCEHTTVGRRIAALEAALAVTLFTRTPEGLAPTRAATELVPLAEAAARSIDAIAQVASGRDDRLTGTVRVTLPEAFAGFLIGRLVELKTRLPDVTLELISDNRVLDLARGECDVALRFAPTTQPTLIVTKLSEVNGAVYAAPAYVARRGVPEPIERLAGHELVGYDDSLANVPAARWLAAHGTGATVTFRGNNLLSVRAAAAAGGGLTVLPCWLGDREPALQRLSGVVCSGALYLVANPDAAKLARVRAVIDFLTDAVARDRAQLAG
ncbi:MAG TPA: LysR family transcriptional regulator [Kofleriaceae bacterium]|nr:LysR family transcriptional regulator [Kofleriaceae bacterium]